jgi:hypothetical protein
VTGCFPVGSDPCEEAFPVDHDASDLSLPDDLRLRADVLGDHLEPDQPAVDVHRRGRHPYHGADGACTDVVEPDPGADAGLLIREAGVQRGAGGGLAPRQQPRGSQNGQVAGAQRRGGVPVP